MDDVWYLTKIHMQDVFCKFVFEHIGETFGDSFMTTDLAMRSAISLGALCREYQLRKLNEGICAGRANSGKPNGVREGECVLTRTGKL